MKVEPQFIKNSTSGEEQLEHFALRFRCVGNDINRGYLKQKYSIQYILKDVEDPITCFLNIFIENFLWW